MTNTTTIADTHTTVANIVYPDGTPAQVCNTECAQLLREDVFIDAPEEGRNIWMHPQGVCAFDGRPLG